MVCSCAADRTKGYPRHQADQMIADWQADVASSLNVVTPCDMGAFLKKENCSGGDSNPHALRHAPLKRTCLPFHHPSEGREI